MNCRRILAGLLIVVCAAVLIISCKRVNDFLDVKPTKGAFLPKTVEDFQALLDYEIMNSNYTALGLLSSDNYYVTDLDFSSSDPFQTSAYIWSKDLYNIEKVGVDWNFPYQRIAYSNSILEEVNKIEEKNGVSKEYENIKGQALFFRSFAYYELLQLFATPYSISGDELPGVVIRRSADPLEIVFRSSLGDCYKRIVEDLKLSISLINQESQYQIRPNKVAARALLAKVYLAMSKYFEALQEVKIVLAEKNDLLDFNALPVAMFESSFPTIGKNPEILFYASQAPYYSFIAQLYLGIVDTTLYSKYEENDLRRVTFFENLDGMRFKGSYTGQLVSGFSGLATNEMYFISAECNARLGYYDDAVNDINTVLSTRYLAGTYEDYLFTSSVELLKKIIEEKRKELPFTGNVRWEDLRRIRLDPELTVTPKRIIQGQVYELSPTSNRYTFPIPLEEINSSGIPQNP